MKNTGFFGLKNTSACKTFKQLIILHSFFIFGCGVQPLSLQVKNTYSPSINPTISPTNEIPNEIEIEKLLLDYNCKTESHHKGIKEVVDSPAFQLKGYVHDMLLWPEESSGGWKISVCFEHDSQFLQQHSNEINTVIQTLTNTWSRFSDIEFTGFQSCTSDSKGIRILVSDENPHTKGLGRQLDGTKNGMVLNFDFLNWGSVRNPKPSTKKALIEIVTVHEFGHALGFAHEHHRPDMPSELLINSGTYQGKKAKFIFSSSLFGSLDHLRDNVLPEEMNWSEYESANDSAIQVQIVDDLQGLEMPIKEYECKIRGSGGTSTAGNWDFYSVMNYCHPGGKERSVLSAGDILSVKKFYTKKVNTSPYTPPLVTSPSSLQENKNRGVTIVDFQVTSSGVLSRACRADSSISRLNLNEGVHESYLPNDIRLCKKEDAHALPIVELQITKNACPFGENWSKIPVDLNSYWDNYQGVFYWQAGSLSNTWGTPQPYYLCVKKDPHADQNALRVLKNIWVSPNNCHSQEETNGIVTRNKLNDTIEWVSRTDINANLGRFPFFTWPESRKICARWGEP